MSRAKFGIGDKVKLLSSGKLGEVKAVFDGNDWNLHKGEHEYTVEFDDGSGAVNIVERVLEHAHVKTCECGLKYARSGGKHSTWCPLYSMWEDG